MWQTIKRLLGYWFNDECPKCGAYLDYSHHGYNQKWAHCRNCGWCTYHKHYTDQEFHND